MLRLVNPSMQMTQNPDLKPIDWIFYQEFRKTGLWFILGLLGLVLLGTVMQWIVFYNFFTGMLIGAVLMWFSLQMWARLFFSTQDRAIGLQRMLVCAVLGLPLGICAAFGVVHYYPQGALGFGFGVSSPVFYAIWPIWRLRNHKAHLEQIP